MWQSEEMSLTQQELVRYSRHLVLPNFNEEHQLKLKKAKVLVIGAGGLGVPVLQYLTAAGVGSIGIVDADMVDESNLQRQVLYTENDIGKNKAELAKKSLEQLNGNVNFTVYPIRLTSSNALEIAKNYDVIVDGTDNFASRYLINDTAVILNKPLVYGSIHRFEGQVAVFNYKNGPNYRDLFPVPPNPNDVPNCEEGGVLGVLPGIIGSMQANEAIKILTQISEPLSEKLFLFNALNMSSYTLEIEKDINQNKITALIDYDEFCGAAQNNLTISLEEFQQLRKGAFQLIDVREAYEYEEYNIGGKLIPLGEIEQHLDKIEKDNLVVIHCKTGARSSKAVDLLVKQYDYQNIRSLAANLMEV